jgi:hypothetical protein
MQQPLSKSVRGLRAPRGQVAQASGRQLDRVLDGRRADLLRQYPGRFLWCATATIRTTRSFSRYTTLAEPAALLDSGDAVVSNRPMGALRGLTLFLLVSMACLVAGCSGTVIISGSDRDGGDVPACVDLIGCGKQRWVRHFAGPYSQDLVALGWNEHDEILLAGSFFDTITFDDITLHGGSPSFYLVWLDSSGWAVRGRAYADSAYVQAMAIADNGDLILGGRFDTALSLGDKTLGAPNGLWSGFVALLDPDGEVRWVRGFPTQHTDSPSIEAVTADPYGNVVVSGHYSEIEDLLPEHGGAARNGGFVAKYDATGTMLWTLLAEADSAVDLRGLAVNHEVEIMVVGEVADGGELHLGALSVPNPTPHRSFGFGARIDGSGHPASGQAFGQDSAGGAAEAYPEGAFLVGGAGYGEVSLGPWTSSGSSLMFIARTDGTDDVAWGTTVAVGAWGHVMDLATSTDGHTSASGRFQESIDFGDGLQEREPWTTAFGFVTESDGSIEGYFLPRKLSDRYADSVGAATIILPSGMVVFGGYFKKEIDVGNGVFTALGDYIDDTDVFVAAFGP